MFMIPRNERYASFLHKEADSKYWRVILPAIRAAQSGGYVALQAHLASRTNKRAEMCHRDISDDAVTGHIDNSNRANGLIEDPLEDSSFEHSIVDPAPSVHTDDDMHVRTTVIIDDGTPISDVDSSAFLSPRLHRSEGELHLFQTTIIAIMGANHDLIRKFACQCNPELTSEGRRDFFMNVGNLNKTEGFLFGALLPGITRFFTSKFREDTDEAADIDKCVYDLEDWLDRVSEVPSISELRQLQSVLVVASGLRACHRSGGMHTASRLFRSLVLPWLYVTHHDLYCRIVTYSDIIDRTVSDSDIVAMIIAESIEMGNGCLPSDWFIEELHRLFNLEVPRKYSSKELWMHRISEKTITGTTDFGSALSKMGKKTSSIGRSPFGSININRRSLHLVERALALSFPMKLTSAVIARGADACFKDLNGQGHALLSRYSLSGSIIPMVADDLPRAGTAIGWLDLRKTVFGQSTSCPTEGPAGRDDVDALASSHCVVNAVSLQRTPIVLRNSAATAVHLQRILDQAKANAEEDIRTAFKGFMALLALYIQRYKKNRVQEGTNEAHLYANVTKPFAALVKQATDWRHMLSHYCTSLDVDAAGRPTPPPNPDAICEPNFMQQIPRHRPTLALEQEARASLRARGLDLRSFCGPPRNSIPIASPGAICAASAEVEFYAFIARANCHPQPIKEGRRKQAAFVTGALNGERSVDFDLNFAAEMRNIRDMFKPAFQMQGQEALRTRERRIQARTVRKRTEMDVLRSLRLRRDREKRSEESAARSFWITGAVPSAAIAECISQLERINKAPKEGHACSSAPRSRRRTCVQCLWRQNAEQEICGREFGTKKALSVHQLENAGAHRIFECAAKVGPDRDTACAAVFYCRVLFDEHKKQHRQERVLARKEADSVRNDRR